jgi:hypothetical protein
LTDGIRPQSHGRTSPRIILPKNARFNSLLTALSITQFGHSTYRYKIAVIDKELGL